MIDFAIAPEVQQQLMFVPDGDKYDQMVLRGRAITRARYYSADNIESRVRTWKRLKSLRGSVNTDAAVKWALAGFNGWVNDPVKLTPTNPRFAECSRKCPKSVPSSFDFRINWGGEEFEGR